MFLLIMIPASLMAETTPTARLNQSLAFADDMNFENLNLAVDRQLKSFEQVGLACSSQTHARLHWAMGPCSELAPTAVGYQGRWWPLAYGDPTLLTGSVKTMHFNSHVVV